MFVFSFCLSSISGEERRRKNLRDYVLHPKKVQWGKTWSESTEGVSQDRFRYPFSVLHSLMLPIRGVSPRAISCFCSVSGDRFVRMLPISSKSWVPGIGMYDPTSE